jgi:hypothetical protein
MKLYEAVEFQATVCTTNSFWPVVVIDGPLTPAEVLAEETTAFWVSTAFDRATPLRTFRLHCHEPEEALRVNVVPASVENPLVPTPAPAAYL